jgi:hypothetical protein
MSQITATFPVWRVMLISKLHRFIDTNEADINGVDAPNPDIWLG